MVLPLSDLTRSQSNLWPTTFPGSSRAIPYRCKIQQTFGVSPMTYLINQLRLILVIFSITNHQLLLGCQRQRQLTNPVILGVYCCNTPVNYQALLLRFRSLRWSRLSTLWPVHRMVICFKNIYPLKVLVNCKRARIHMSWEMMPNHRTTRASTPRKTKLISQLARRLSLPDKVFILSQHSQATIKNRHVVPRRPLRLNVGITLALLNLLIGPSTVTAPQRAFLGCLPCLYSMPRHPLSSHIKLLLRRLNRSSCLCLTPTRSHHLHLTKNRLHHSPT